MKQRQIGESFPTLARSMSVEDINKLITDSPEWESIAWAYADVMIALPKLLVMGEEKAAAVLLTFAQAIYVQGYKRGKAEKAMPIFMVGEEE